MLPFMLDFNQTKFSHLRTSQTDVRRRILLLLDRTRQVVPPVSCLYATHNKVRSNSVLISWQHSTQTSQNVRLFSQIMLMQEHKHLSNASTVNICLFKHGRLSSQVNFCFRSRGGRSSSCANSNPIFETYLFLSRCKLHFSYRVLFMYN